MDDDFLKRYYDAPRPAFSRLLYERISREPMNAQSARNRRATLWRWSPALVAVSLLLVAALALTFEPTRALAQDFLNLFRVKKFAAITIDPARIQALENSELDIEKLLGDNIQVIKEAGKPEAVATLDEASARAGFTVRAPTDLPGDAQLKAFVQDEGIATITADTEKLDAVLDILGIDDVRMPPALNGASVTVKKPTAVILNYTLPRASVSLMQSPSPEVELPPGVDLAQLGEIALRAAGMSRQEAADFARKIDWHSTLLIPIPAGAGEFRQVEINGADGLMVTSSGTGTNRQSSYAKREAVILWSDGEMVYALHGTTTPADLLEIANSVR